MEIIKIINHKLNGKVGEISKKAWDENKHAMADWEEYGIELKPEILKPLSEEKIKIRKRNTNI